MSTEKSHAREATAESYFFAARNVHWPILGISFLTSCIVSPYILGLTSMGSSVLVAVLYGVVSMAMLAILGRYLVPLFFSMGVKTLPEYLEHRFGHTTRLLVSILYITQNIVLRLMIILGAGSVIIGRIVNVDAFSSLLFFLIVTGLYVIIGGLRAEIYASIVQVVLIAVGILGLVVWAALQGNAAVVPDMTLASATAADPLLPPVSWTGLAFGLPVLGFWFWCADQFIAQRVMSVKNVASARNGAIVVGALQVVMVAVFVFLGNTGTAAAQGLRPGDPSHPLFAEGFLPMSLRVGLIIAVAAALMASFAGLFSSTSLLITFDFYRRLKPEASDRTLVLVGRMTTIALLFYAILVIPISQMLDLGMCLKLFKIYAYFAALISAVMIMGMLHARVTAPGAVTALSVGTVLILLRTMVEFSLGQQAFAQPLLQWIAATDFLEFSVIVFLISALVLLAVRAPAWKTRIAQNS